MKIDKGAASARIIEKAPKTKHVISCAQDKTVWGGIARMGFDVYSGDTIMASALRQEMNWDDRLR